MACSRLDLTAATWRRSSYSNSSGGDCLEVAEEFAHWRKSSHSNTSGGDCLEVADGHPGIVPVRDSKRPEGPVLVLPASAWTPFIDSVKAV
ncbi:MULTISPECIES: DUF397 domain-containing protein [unclassified Streptomyces]|uniref:DUF397 domain-containing protein n=1 Tax=unclassified Streptomyces TaxID=2593676 RepID=UPI00093E5A12|nr:DUF397 domain-containing protein [Streptomyces sp. CB01580]OKJ28055.1 toxin [Streptomyces sp. CB01580]